MLLRPFVCSGCSLASRIYARADTHAQPWLQPDLHALVRELASGVTTALVPDVTCLLPAPPYAILGHSFGAWLAFELALELRRRGLPPPVKLYVSANRPPCLASPEHDPDPLGPSISTLPPAHFWPRFEGRYGANPDIKSPAVRAFLYPLLCADFAVIENYRGPPPSEAPLTCSLAAIGAHGDGRYRPEQLDAWRGHTSGCFEKRWFTAKVVNDWATPHRFMIDEPSEFQEWLSEDLLRAAAAVNAHE
jgi:surfactin synthase thioesterase subunit